MTFYLTFLSANPISVNFNVFIAEEINGMSVSKTTVWPLETIHLVGSLFLNDGDIVKIKLSSGKILITELIATSGLSIVKITEADQSASFTSILKVSH